MIELVACVVFLVSCSSIYWLHITPPYQRPIPYQLLENSNDYVLNLTINEIFKGDTISNVLLMVLSFILPLIIQLALSKTLGQAGDAHGTLCVYMIALGITILATEFVKLYAGYLRPNFYYLCEPTANFQECTTADVGDKYNIRKSFPSGHGSVAFCGLTILTLYLHNRFGIPNYRRQKQEQNEIREGSSRGQPLHPAPFRFISIFSLTPMALAIFIAASRIRDNQHFPADVVGGSVLGTSVAVFVYNLWFAS